MRDTTVAIVVIAILVMCALFMGDRAIAVSKEILPIAFTAIGSLSTGIVIGRRKGRDDKSRKDG